VQYEYDALETPFGNKSFAAVLRKRESRAPQKPSILGSKEILPSQGTNGQIKAIAFNKEE